MKRMSSLSALVAAFPSVHPEALVNIRAVWRLAPDKFPAFIADKAPRTHAWVRSCFNPPARMEIRRRACDELLDTHGVELLGVHRRSGERVYYCNSGDTYAPTIIFHGGTAYIGCWGDLVERGMIREEARVW